MAGGWPVDGGGDKGDVQRHQVCYVCQCKNTHNEDYTAEINNNVKLKIVVLYYFSYILILTRNNHCMGSYSNKQ